MRGTTSNAASPLALVLRAKFAPSTRGRLYLLRETLHGHDRNVAAGSAASACGEASAGRSCVATKPVSVKQEAKGRRAPDGLNSKVQVVS
jgi:hypothetical protein